MGNLIKLTLVVEYETNGMPNTFWKAEEHVLGIVEHDRSKKLIGEIKAMFRSDMEDLGKYRCTTCRKRVPYDQIRLISAQNKKAVAIICVECESKIGLIPH